jgi:ribosomal protein S18 acetylase RimI-like enzyme
MKIVTVVKAESRILESLNALLAQLSESVSLLSFNELENIVASDCATLLTALEEDHIVGILTLVIFRIPTGMRARIEDVVVDASARGKAIGERLVRQAIKLARHRGAHGVDLTSNPERTAANRLYRKIGFVTRKTNTYRYVIQ